MGVEGKTVIFLLQPKRIKEMPIFIPLWHCISVPLATVGFYDVFWNRHLSLQCIRHIEFFANTMWVAEVHAKSQLIIYHLRQFKSKSKSKQWYDIKHLFVAYVVISFRISHFVAKKKNCSLQNGTQRKMPHIALEKKAVYSNAHNIEIDVKTAMLKCRRQTKETKKKMCVVSSTFTVGQSALS